MPAVVGMATRGGSGRSTRRSPFILARLRPGYTTQAPVALAQSMEEPPPKATSAWQPPSRYSSVASATFCTVGLGWVPSYTWQAMPRSVRAFSRVAVAPDVRRKESVTKSTDVMPSPTNSSAQSEMAGRIRGLR